MSAESVPLPSTHFPLRPSAARLLVVSNATDSAGDHFRRLCYDPLVLQLGLVEVQMAMTGDPPGEGVTWPALSELDEAAAVDLVILPRGEFQRLPPPATARLRRYLERGGALLAVQPTDERGAFPEALLGPLGLERVTWEPATPSLSLAGADRAARVAGVAPGGPVALHRPWWGHQALCPAANTAGRALSVLAQGGAPDLWLADPRRAQAALVATDLMGDAQRHGKHPDYRAYRRATATLLGNALRMLLGGAPATEPRTDAEWLWAERLHAYALGRRYVEQLHALLVDRLSATEVRAELAAADGELRLAAAAFDAGDRPGAEAAYRAAVRRLSGLVDRLTGLQRWIIRGWHGGMFFDDWREGGVVGYAEFGWGDLAMRWMRRQLAWAAESSAAQLNDVSPQTWLSIARYYPDDLALLRRATLAGTLEPTGGLFSPPYMQMVGPESNVRQFLHGHAVLKELLGDAPDVYVCANDHHGFHPQLPQLLAGFDYRAALLRCGELGEIRPVAADAIRWHGLDGTEILALPSVAAPGRQAWTPQALAAQARAGQRVSVLGFATDATLNLPDERDQMLLQQVAPIAGTMISTRRALGALPARPGPSVYFSADDLYGRVQWWSGFGSLNQSFRRDRQLERLLLAAERWDAALSLVMGPAASGERALWEAWRDLLTTHDHMTYGCAREYNIEGHRTGDFFRRAMDNYPGPTLPVACQSKMDEHLDRCEAVARAVHDHALQALAARIDTAAVAGAAGGRVAVLFNPSGWSYDGVVEIGGRPRPVRVPPVGYTTIRLEAPVADPGEGGVRVEPGGAGRPWVLENSLVRAELDSRHGALVSLYDKARQCELLDRAAGPSHALLSPERPRLSSLDGGASLEPRGGSRCQAGVRISGHLGSYPHTTTVSLAAGSPCVDIRTEIDFGEGAFFGYKQRDETALGVHFRFADPSGTGRLWLSQPFGVYSTERLQQVALEFLDWTTGASGDSMGGVALLFDATPGFTHHGNAVALILADGFPPTSGKQVYRYALLPHGDTAAAAGVLWAHEAWVTPPHVIETVPHAGDLPAEGSFAGVDVEGGDRKAHRVALSALYRQAGRLTARLYETAGESVAGVLRVGVPGRPGGRGAPPGQATASRPVGVGASRGVAAVQRAVPVNLAGRALGQSLPAADGAIHFRLAPWRIGTWHLTEGPGGQAAGRSDVGRSAPGDGAAAHSAPDAKRVAAVEPASPTQQRYSAPSEPAPPSLVPQSPVPAPVRQKVYVPGSLRAAADGGFSFRYRNPLGEFYLCALHALAVFVGEERIESERITLTAEGEAYAFPRLHAANVALFMGAEIEIAVADHRLEPGRRYHLRLEADIAGFFSGRHAPGRLVLMEAEATALGPTTDRST